MQNDETKYLRAIYELAQQNEKPLIIVENPRYVAYKEAVLNKTFYTLSVEEQNRRFDFDPTIINIGNANAKIGALIHENLMEAYVELKVKLNLEKELQNAQGNKQSDTLATNPTGNKA